MHHHRRKTEVRQYAATSSCPESLLIGHRWRELLQIEPYRSNVVAFIALVWRIATIKFVGPGARLATWPQEWLTPT